jgi:hypothetical protein
MRNTFASLDLTQARKSKIKKPYGPGYLVVTKLRKAVTLIFSANVQEGEPAKYR